MDKLNSLGNPLDKLSKGVKAFFLVCALAMMSLISCFAQNTGGQSEQTTRDVWIEHFKEKCIVADSSIEGFKAYDEYPWWGKDGLIPVHVGNKWGFADTNANIVIEPQFEDVSYFYEERAGVCLRKKWGYIDRAGNIVIPLKYNLVGRFQFGTVQVMKGRGHWFELDKQGNVLDRY